MATIQERLARMKQDAGAMAAGRERSISERLSAMRSDANAALAGRNTPQTPPLRQLAMETVTQPAAPRPSPRTDSADYLGMIDAAAKDAQSQAQPAYGKGAAAPGAPGGGGRGGYSAGTAGLQDELNRLRTERNNLDVSAYASGDPADAVSVWERQQQINSRIGDLEKQLKAAGVDTPDNQSPGKFIGDALDVLQANLQTPLSSLDKGSYWLDRKLGLVDPADQI